MASINLGNFGGARADTRLANVTSIAGQSIQSAAPVRPGDMMVALGNQLADDTNQQVQKLQKARATEELAKLGVKADEMRLQIFDDVNAGRVKPEESLKVYNERLAEYQDNVIASTDDPALAEMLAPAMQEYSVRQQSQVMMTQHSLIQGEHKTRMANTIGAIATQAQGDPQAAIGQMEVVIRNMGPQAGLGQADQDALIQKTKQDFWMANQAFVINQSTDIAQLRQMEQDYGKPDKYTDIQDPDNRNGLIRAAQSRINHLEAEQERQARLAEVQENDQARFVLAALNDGNPVNPQMLAWADSYIASGKDKTGAVESARTVYDERGSALKMTIAGSAAYVDTLKSEMSKVTSPRARAMLGDQAQAHEKILAQRVTTIQKDPFGQGSAMHGMQPLPPLNFGQPLDQQIGPRIQRISELKAATGMDIALFSPAEAKEFGQVMQTLTPAKQREQIAAVVAFSPNKNATIAQLRNMGDSGIALAAAANWQAADRNGYVVDRMNSGQRPSDTILQGNAIRMNKDAVKLYSWMGGEENKQIRAKIQEELGGSVAQIGDAALADIIINTENALLAMGETKNNKDRPSDDAIKSAIKIAAGGYTIHNGSKVISPPGVNDYTFKTMADKMLAETAATFAAGNESAKQNLMKNGRIMAVGGGDEPGTVRYAVTLDGNKLRGKDGRELTFDMDTSSIKQVKQMDDAAAAKAQEQARAKAEAMKATEQKHEAWKRQGLAPSPTAFPRVSPEEQAARDVKRDEILKAEGTTAAKEMKAVLSTAKGPFAEKNVNKKQILSDELSREKVNLEKLQREGKNQNAIKLAQANIRDLEKEIGKL